MVANFAVGDKVRIRGEKGFENKTGLIIKNLDKERIPKGVRKLGEGFKTEEGRQQWLVKLDVTQEEVTVLEENLEKLT